MHRIIVGHAIRLARAPLVVARWVVRNALDHPHTVSNRDASAAALWPYVAEEVAPPRWPVVPPDAAPHASGGRHTSSRTSPVIVMVPAPCGTTQVSPLRTWDRPSSQRISPAPDSMTSTAKPAGSS